MWANIAAYWWLTAFTVTATEVDLLGALFPNNNTTRPGVGTAAGSLQPSRISYHLEGDHDLQVPAAVFGRAAQLLRNSPEFTLMATLRQEPSNSGSIISFSHGFNRYLELQSSGRRDEIRFHYVAVGTTITRVETFPFRLADGEWHKVALSVSGSQVQLLVDCHPLYRRSIPQPDRNFTEPNLGLWVGQRNSKHSLFKGTFQDVRLITGAHGYLAQCPNLDSECPTCGQFTLLQATVQQLAVHLQDLSNKLVAAEERVGRLEQCDCQKSCFVNDTLHADGATWQDECDICACVHGDVRCRPVKCPIADCKSPVVHPGECCPTCLKECFMLGTKYDHGDRVTPKECAECVCHDGNMECRRVDQQTACPPLPCDVSQQFSVPGECCKFCPGVDYCSMGHTCDENATCMNLNTKYTCKCNEGFQGDGITCQDINECSTAGGLEGHHCHTNTKCSNTFGSYTCDCIVGYSRLDKYTCIEIDECSVGSHDCDDKATCTNVAGSYNCTCLPGYAGDGSVCEPICTGGCLNGGTCVSAEWCSCPDGFSGARCESDVDECSSLDSAPICPYGSRCINTPGSYFCKCLSGYRSDALSNTCIDVDECSEGTHTCHPTAVCQNIEGSFTCECRTPDCQLSCMSSGIVVADKSRWLDSGGCHLCECASGVLTCAAAQCPCDTPEQFRDNSTQWAAESCCPHCDEKYNCHHQEMHHVTFRSGERWLYQCQTCECLLGEVDCWEAECGVCCGPGCASALAECPSCQVAQCSSLVSNNACCVHRWSQWWTSAWMAAALVATSSAWTGGGFGVAQPRRQSRSNGHRKRTRRRPPPQEQH